jgi:pimeloyl-ACP methyl ester carboxylesterase
MGMSRHALSALGSASFHRLAYVDWGAPGSERVLLCVHGLTRTGRDFDFIAAALEDSYRVVCPDVLGRGASGWAASAKDYNTAQYVADATALIARLGVERVDWLGTSMGGLMGLFAASLPGTPVRCLILNDIGPFVPTASLERIAAYVGKDPRFADIGGVEQYLRTVHAPFGALTDTQWRHLATHSARPLDDGKGGGGYGLAYDPAIGDAFRANPLADLDLWALWDRIECPVLVLRGAESDLLTRSVAEEMTQRGPKAELIEFPGCGHAPALMAAEQIAAVRAWLLR